jgi:hypothetical protein
MTIMDAAAWLSSHAGFVALRPTGAMWTFNPAFRCVRPTGKTGDYIRFNQSDLVAVDWRVMTPEQMEREAAELAENGA